MKDKKSFLDKLREIAGGDLMKRAESQAKNAKKGTNKSYMLRQKIKKKLKGK